MVSVEHVFEVENLTAQRKYAVVREGIDPYIVTEDSLKVLKEYEDTQMESQNCNSNKTKHCKREKKRLKQKRKRLRRIEEKRSQSLLQVDELLDVELNKSDNGQFDRSRFSPLSFDSETFPFHNSNHEKDSINAVVDKNKLRIKFKINKQG